jgi:hypothetical protein
MGFFQQIPIDTNLQQENITIIGTIFTVLICTWQWYFQ